MTKKERQWLIERKKELERNTIKTSVNRFKLAIVREISDWSKVTFYVLDR